MAGASRTPSATSQTNGSARLPEPKSPPDHARKTFSSSHTPPVLHSPSRRNQLAAQIRALLHIHARSLIPYPSSSLHLNNKIISLNQGTLTKGYLLHAPAPRRDGCRLHLHRFYCKKRRSFFDLSANTNRDPREFPLKRRANFMR